MKYRKFIKDNFAVAGVLEAILLIALVAIILSMIQLYYIPVIMEQKEADHMDQVSNQLSQLKSVIEIQSMMGTMETGKSITYTPMSSPITLGSKELPYFVSARSYGQIDVIDQNDAGDHMINIQPMSIPEFVNGISLTSIIYRANNFYYPEKIDHWQEYILEGGGIILKQSDGEVMRVYPGITIENNSDLGNIKINYFIPIFNGVPGKKSYSDWEDCYIYTNYTAHYTHSGNATFLKIYTDYPDAWYKSLVDESRGILWEYYHNGYLNVELDNTVIPNIVKITPGSKFIYLELTIAEIGVQVGPGYVTRE